MLTSNLAHIANMDNIALGWSTSGPDIGQLTNFIIIFIVVCVLAYFTTRLIAGARYGRLGKRNIQIIETVSVGQAAFIHLVRLGNEFILIGVTKGQINFLTKVANDAIDLSEYQKNVVSPPTFETLLGKFTKEDGSLGLNLTGWDKKAQREMNELYGLAGKADKPDDKINTINKINKTSETSKNENQENGKG